MGQVENVRGVLDMIQDDQLDNVGPDSKLVALILADYNDHAGRWGCPSSENVQDMLGLSQERMEVAIQELGEAGLLRTLRTPVNKEAVILELMLPDDYTDDCITAAMRDVHDMFADLAQRQRQGLRGLKDIKERLRNSNKQERE